MRGILFAEGIPDPERVDRAKWLNEIAHRITSKVYVSRLNLHEWTESDIWEMIKGYVEENPAIEEEVNAAVKWSYGSVRNNESDRI